MTIDILTKIGDGSLTEDEALTLISDFLDSDLDDDICDLFGLSKVEWTAYCHCVSLDELAAWRTSGWPQPCVICGKDIDIHSYGWTAMEVDGVSFLRHISCAPP